MDLSINSSCFVKRENIIRQYVADLVNTFLMNVYTSKLWTIPAPISDLIINPFRFSQKEYEETRSLKNNF